MDPLLVGVGGAFGAAFRYLVGIALPDTPFPWPTLAVNALGSFILGCVILTIGDGALFLLIGVGFCGAFTTFSTFSYQTIGFWETEHYLLATVNAVGNLVVSLLAFGVALVVFA